MTAKTQKLFYVERSYKTKRRYCPDCRGLMAIADQFREDRSLFTCYECTKAGCSGQWLQKDTVKHCG